MAVRKFDGFDVYDGTASIVEHRGWVRANGSSGSAMTYNQTGRFGTGKSLALSGGIGGTQSITEAFTAGADQSVGFAFSAPPLGYPFPPQHHPFFFFNHAANTEKNWDTP